jgi:hypothetical protein
MTKFIFSKSGATLISIFLLFLTHLVLPLTFILRLGSTFHANIIAWILALYIAGSYLLFIYLTGAWSWFGNTVRQILVILLVIAAVTGFPNSHPAMTISDIVTLDSLLAIGVGTIFIGMALFALTGRFLKSPALELTFPLGGRIFIVAQGGSNTLINHHASNSSQQFALDLLKLNTLGLRTRGLYPSNPKHYAIFGTEVISPCAGVVVAVKDGFPDLSPPERDPQHRAGNFIALECKGSTVYLAHLQKGSICVATGEQVHTGQLLGRVGNSGNTSEPHLHIHAEAGSYPGHFSGQPGIPIRFSGRFLVRNNRFKVSA